MKIRKLLSAFLSVAMVSSLIASFSVAHAADVPTLTATTEYDDTKSWIVVTVSYSGFENFVAYDEEEGNVKGIPSMSFSVIPDAEVTYKGGVKSTAQGCLNVGSVSLPNTGKAIFAFNASSMDTYVTQTEGTLCKFRFEAAKDANVNFTITDPIIRVTEWTGWSMSTPVDYIGTSAITVNNASYGSSAPVLADFTDLNAAIAAYEAKTEADYTAESWATAKAAYDTAKAIDQAAETDQYKVNAAATALTNAIATLVEKIEDKVTVTPDERSEKKDNASGLWTYGFSGTVTTTGSASYSRLIFNFKDGDKQGKEPYIWEVGTSLNTPITYGLNIWGCPVGSDVTATVTAE